ncbi:MAG: phospholipase domain-containing protein [Micromonosporaceae bacterium]
MRNEWDNYQNNNVEFYKSFRDVARKALAPQGLKSMHTFYGRVRAASEPDRATLLAKLEDGVKTLTAAERSPFERGLRRVRTGELTASFRSDVERGAVPAVSWIVAPESQCEHPSSDGPSTGSELVWQLKSTGKVWIDMASQGTVRTHFSVYANAYRTDGPWRYDVAPGATVSDYFSVQTYGGGRYDLSCYGPNGFSRRLTGDLNAPGVTAEVTAAITTDEAGMVWLTFANTGTSAVTFTVKPNAYRGDGPWSYTVPAGGTVKDYWHAGWYGNRWYDLTATVSSDPSFSRRFRGYIENGSHGVTG